MAKQGVCLLDSLKKAAEEQRVGGAEPAVSQIKAAELGDKAAMIGAANFV